MLLTWAVSHALASQQPVHLEHDTDALPVPLYSRNAACSSGLWNTNTGRERGGVVGQCTYGSNFGGGPAGSVFHAAQYIEQPLFMPDCLPDPPALQAKWQGKRGQRASPTH